MENYYGSYTNVHFLFTNDSIHIGQPIREKDEGSFKSLS